jgi:ribonucleoside-triphosphate reductase
MEHYHHEQVQKVITQNRRVGVGITGCLESPLFNPETLNDAYQAIQAEDEKYSAELGINKSVKTTVIKPSGTMSKVLDQRGEGIHAAFSRFMIQRIRVGANDPLIALLRAAGHYMEPEVKFDGTTDPNTLVVDFYLEAPEGMPCADEGFDTWKQLDVLLMAQKYWADQAVSVTVYYRKEELDQIKEWLKNNFKYLKTISFLCHNDHGFKQAPKEAITKEKYEELSQKVKSINTGEIEAGAEMEGLECEGGVCPIK